MLKTKTKKNSIHEVKIGLSSHPNHISSCRLIFLCWTLSSLNAAKKMAALMQPLSRLTPLSKQITRSAGLKREYFPFFKVQQQKTILPKSTERDKKTTERKRVSWCFTPRERERESRGAGEWGWGGGGAREVGRERERWRGKREREGEREKERMCAYKLCVSNSLRMVSMDKILHFRNTFIIYYSYVFWHLVPMAYLRQKHESTNYVHITLTTSLPCCFQRHAC